MNVIRSGVFETNSSSSHTIVVNPKETKVFKLHPLVDSDGYMVFDFKFFGWGPYWVDTAIEKLEYLIAYSTNYITDSAEELNPVLDDIWNDEYVDEKYNDLADLVHFIKSNVDTTDIVGIRLRKSGYLAGIDHESYNETMHSLISNTGLSLEEFVLNRSVRIRITNDNEEDEELEEALEEAKYHD